VAPPFVLELFGGCGGLAEGLRRAGLRPSLTVERDDDACDSYARNLDLRPLRLDVRELVRATRAGWHLTSPVDLLVADPTARIPQASDSAEGGVDQEMLGLVTAFVQLVRPRAFLVAYGKGRDDERDWSAVQRTIGDLSAGGYCVRDALEVDAADYGVPQHRWERFLYGHCDGPCVRWPERTHGSPEECATLALPGTRGLLPWATCRAALAQVHAPEPFGRRDGWPWEAPATTVSTTGRIGKRSPNASADPQTLRLSEAAAGLLQGFPDGWQIVGSTKRSRWAQIGGAIPPPLAEAVGRSIRAALEPGVTTVARRSVEGLCCEARP
jgi:DNA (cytosine-5)-methyltransferase 1